MFVHIFGRENPDEGQSWLVVKITTTEEHRSVVLAVSSSCVQTKQSKKLYSYGNT